ncbi:MAG TPA: hypothetical protein VGM03_23980, partial [Phycisphaerae bacterium]
MRRMCCSAVMIASTVWGIAVRADCPAVGWQEGFGAPGVTSNLGPAQVNALYVWDADGPEGPLAPVLVVGGAFNAAGGAPAINITVWDGQSFR